MIWQNPWAWLGVATLALPVLIHLLSRHVARVLKFPTLRFLEVSRLTPVRRTRLSDPLLLLVRLAILGAAVAALAQPLLLTAGRRHDIERATARAIVVDTSLSMRRPARAVTNGVAGERAIDVARREAKRLASEASASVVMESNAPGQALAGAIGWLNTQGGSHEVVILSDFQLGTIDEGDLAVVPHDVGVKLVRVDVNTSAAAPIVWTTQSGSVETVAHLTLTTDRTGVEWTTHSAAHRNGSGFMLVAGPLERTLADAALQAALSTSALSLSDTTHAIAIIYPHAESRAQLLRDAKPIDRLWMGDVVAGMRGDSTLIGAASSGSIEGDSAGASSGFVVVARNDSGRAVAYAAHGVVGGQDRLLIFSSVDAGSLASAAMIGAAARTAFGAVAASELEPGVLDDQTLAAWQRSPGASGRDPSLSLRMTDEKALRMTGESDGRWIWFLVLVLIALETFMRRSSRKETPVELVT